MKFQRIQLDYTNPKHREEWLMKFFTIRTQRNLTKLQVKAKDVSRWIDMGGTLSFSISSTINGYHDITFYHISCPIDVGGGCND